MAIVSTTELGPNCRTGAVPLASLELFESPDSLHDPRALHPGIETTVQVLDGVVYVTAEEHEWALTPGDAATIPPGVPYRRWNAGEDDARWVEVYCAGY
jgi:mannose-6-phosphate isomerase-like protein (cupin superfamily)